MTLPETNNQETSVSVEEQVPLNQISSSQICTLENQNAVPPNRKKNLKNFNISLLTNVTIKWKGNNRKICTILFIILQLMLTLVLLGKISIVKINKTKLHQNITKPIKELKLLPLVALTDHKSMTTAEQQQETKLPSKPTRQPLVKLNNCLLIKASTEDEFQQKTKNISDQTPICLRIEFNNNSRWNLSNTSPITDMVKEIILVGCVNLVLLSIVLEKFNYGYKITFGQPSNQFCDAENGQFMKTQDTDSDPTEKYLLNLNEIIFENINCQHIFEFLSKTFYMNAVRSLKIKNAEINGKNIVGLRHMLKQFKYSLEILNFTEVIWKVSLFDRTSSQLPNLKELNIDFVSAAHTNVEFLRGFNGANHLLKVVSMRGCIPYNQFASILKFKMLSNVTVGVDVPNDITRLDLFPVNELTNLEYMELFLNFKDISTCYLLTDYDIERPYVTKLNSNCDEDF